MSKKVISCIHLFGTSRHTLISVFVIILIFVGLDQNFAQADFLRTVDRTLRRVADVGDDVPLRHLDELNNAKRAGRWSDELLQTKRRGKILHAVDETRVLDDMWRQMLGKKADDVLQEIRRLSPTQQRVAYLCAEGAQRAKDMFGDIGLRRNFMKDAGPQTLMAMARYPNLAEDAVRFDIAVRGRKLLSPPGARALETADFGRFFDEMGDGAATFWEKYVKPHWPLWLGGAALGAILLTPQEYLDQAGNLTKEGLQKIARFASKTLFDTLRGAAQGTVEGVGQGMSELVRDSVRSFQRTFLTSWSGIVALVLLVVVIALVFKPTRVLIRRVFVGSRR
ncbi:MAG: hypothetical protein RMJ16_11525 [Thermoguttaceae bacterium]|nr:hypothetical protein [Thermoguttaceae bacterium]